MLNPIMIYVGSILILIWGIAHLVPTKSIVKGFGTISIDNQRIITMEWLISGVGMIFVGVLTLLISVFGNSNSIESDIVYLSSSLVLVVFAVITLMTGSKTAIIPIKLCPVINIIAAILIVTGTF